MPSQFRTALAGAIAAAISIVATPTFACTETEIGAVIDQTGERLRTLNMDTKRAIDAKIKALARKKRWSEAEGEAKAWQYLNDGAGKAMDEKAAGLLMRLDRLGDETRTEMPACERLAAAKKASSDLLAINRAKTDRITARLNAALSAAKTAATSPPEKTQKRAPPATFRSQEPDTPASPPPPWSTRTTNATQSTPPPTRQPPLDPTYTAEEIAAAGRGLFGTISSNLAAVIQYAVSTYGRPNGYILGTEGSGAFIAGLRYGSGELVKKDGTTIPVHWQGPSLGYDVGVTGSRVMFLVYNVRTSGDVYRRFAGIDGSAYVVGGAGITVLKRGNVIMAPIRTGLGLRIGANIGYLKFTPEPSYNPF